MYIACTVYTRIQCHVTVCVHLPFPDHHSSMLNLTARLAVKIKNLPDFEFDWADTAPQKPRASLNVVDFLPSEADATVFNQRAVHYMMGFLVETFSSLKCLAEFVPEPEVVHPATKSEVVPMKILYKDEKYKSQTIDILAQLIKDAGLSGNHQVYINFAGFDPPPPPSSYMSSTAIGNPDNRK